MSQTLANIAIVLVTVGICGLYIGAWLEIRK